MLVAFVMNGNNQNQQGVVVAQSTRRRASWPLIVLAALFIVVPFLTWYGTWFGRDLSDEDIASYLQDEKSPRHIQHALSRIEERMEKGDPNVKKFYPQVIALTKSPVGEIRKTTAWVMGQDNSVEEFHRALVGLLNDSEPLVRRNAALQLVRFDDAAGRSELRAMLQPFDLKSTVGGTVMSLLAEGSKVKEGSLVARIRDSSDAVQEIRSPLDGAIGKLAVNEGGAVATRQTLAWLTPDRATVSDALRALAYLGTPDDLALIEPLSQGTATNDPEIKEQAIRTTKAIEGRPGVK